MATGSLDTLQTLISSSSSFGENACLGLGCGTPQNFKSVAMEIVITRYLPKT